MKNLVNLLLATSVFSLSVACSSNNNDPQAAPQTEVLGILEQELQGQVGGVSWKIMQGHLLSETRSDGSESLVLELYTETILECSKTAWGSARHPVVIAHLDGFDKRYIGYEASLNVVGKSAISGTLLPDQVTLDIATPENGYVTGGLAVKMDTRVDLNGYFSVRDCR